MINNQWVGASYHTKHQKHANTCHNVRTCTVVHCEPYLYTYTMYTTFLYVLMTFQVCFIALISSTHFANIYQCDH